MPDDEVGDVLGEQGLGDVFADLRHAYLRPLDDQVQAAHLEAMHQVAAGNVVPLSGRAGSRRKRIVAAAVLSAGVIGVSSGLAAAGVLPEPIQRTISNVVSPLGIHLPDGSSLRPSSPDGRETQTGPNGGGSSPDQTPTSGRPDGNDPTSTDAGASSTGAPGLGGPNPGQADEAPGQQKDPGSSENAPGHGGDNPGQTDSPPPGGGPPTSKATPPSNGGQANNPPKATPTTPVPTTPTTPAPPTTPSHPGGNGKK